MRTPRLWCLLAWDIDRGDWRTFRVDRIQGPLSPPGTRFTPRRLPSDDVAAYDVPQSISSAPYRYQARILIGAPLAAVARRSSPAASRLEAVDQHSCVLHTGSNSLDELALYVALKGFDFQVLDPPELIPVLSARLRQAADASWMERHRHRRRFCWPNKPGKRQLSLGVTSRKCRIRHPYDIDREITPRDVRPYTWHCHPGAMSTKRL